MSGLLPVVLRSLRRRPLRATLTSAAVVLGIAVMLGVQTAVAALDQQASSAQDARAGGSDLDIRVTAGPGLTTDQVAALGKVAGIVEASPLLQKRVSARAAASDIDGLTVTLNGIHGGAAALRPVNLVSGRLPSDGSLNQVAVDSGVLATLAASGGIPHLLRIGDPLALTTETGPDVYTIVGITSGTSGGAAFTRSAVFVSDAAISSAFRLGLRTPLVALRLAPDTSPAAVAAAVRRSVGPSVTAFSPRGSSAQPLSQLHPLLLLVTVLSLIIGAGVTANSISLSAFERRRETALLRAAGASARQVAGMFVSEAVVLSLAAIPFGIAAGLGLAALLAARYAPADLPPPALNADLMTVALVSLIAFAAALLGALLPALIAGRATILEGLRRDAVERRQRPRLGLTASAPVLLLLACGAFFAGLPWTVSAGAVLFLAGVATGLPVVAPAVGTGLGRLVSPLFQQAPAAAANLARRRNRSALAIAGLAVSVATAVAMSAITNGALAAGDQWVGRLFNGDAVVTSPVTERDAVALAIAKASGVQSVSPIRLFPERVAGQVLGIATVDPSAYSKGGGLEVTEPDRHSAVDALAHGTNVLVPAALADVTAWHVGDSIPIATSKGDVAFTVAGIVDHSFPAGDGRESLVIGRPVAQTYFGSTASGFDDLDVVTDGNFTRLADITSSYGLQAVTVDSIREGSRQALEHSVGLLQAVAVIAVAIAMLAVVNTLMVTIRHGVRELALLRAVGMDRTRAFRLVLTEAGLLAAIGTLLGLAAGGVLTIPMLRVSSAPGFEPSFAFPFLVAAVIVGCVIAATLIATAVPARRVAGTDIVKAIRYE